MPDSPSYSKTPHTFTPPIDPENKPRRDGGTWFRLPVSRAPARSSMRVILVASICASLTILIVALLSASIEVTLLLASFGASSVLIFVFPESPLSQPRAVIGGHLVSCLAGMLVFQLLGSSPYSMALAVGLSILFMEVTRMVHPPGGGDGLIIIYGAKDWGFILAPCLFGAVALVLVAYIVHRIKRPGLYPRYWY